MRLTYVHILSSNCESRLHISVSSTTRHYKNDTLLNIILKLYIFRGSEVLNSVDLKTHHHNDDS